MQLKLREVRSPEIRVFKSHEDVGLVYVNGDAINDIGQISYSLFPPAFVEENKPGKILLDCYINTPSSVMVKKKHSMRLGYLKRKMKLCKHKIMICGLS